MKITTEMISSLLRRADIEGYIELGAPKDEYDSEAEALALAFSELNNEEATVENITTIINQAWMQSFNLNESDLDIRQSQINNLVEAILKLNYRNA